MFNPHWFVFIVKIISCTFQYMDKYINICFFGYFQWSSSEDKKWLICIWTVLSVRCGGEQHVLFCTRTHFLQMCRFDVISLKPQAAFDDPVCKFADSWEALPHVREDGCVSNFISWWLPVEGFQHRSPEASHPPNDRQNHWICGGRAQRGVASRAFQLLVLLPTFPRRWIRSLLVSVFMFGSSREDFQRENNKSWI